jgi:predicted transcriptional regulator
MPNAATSEPITVRAGKDVIAEIDAIASATDRSRNYIVNQALKQFLDTNSWQLDRIREGITAADAGDVVQAKEVFEGIAARHGWKS